MIQLQGEGFPVDASRIPQILHCLSQGLPMHLYASHTLFKGDGETCTVTLDGRTVEYSYAALADAFKGQ